MSVPSTSEDCRTSEGFTEQFGLCVRVCVCVTTFRCSAEMAFATVFSPKRTIFKECNSCMMTQKGIPYMKMF